MKKILLLASVAGVCALASMPAHAECDGIYGAFRGGVVKHDMDEIAGDLASEKLMLSGALGYRYNYFRTEFEYIWRDRNNEKEPGHNQTFKTYSMMWNFYYDVLPYNWWSPYLGAGIGVSKVSYSDRDDSFFHEKWDTMKFTWSVGGGLSLKVTNRFNVDAGYRYYDLNNPKNLDTTIQEIYAGIRYVF